MATTKIVNISKSDSFEEVFGEVQKADAKEVILIIPRGSKLAKQSGYFEAFQKEADSSAKLISIMTEDPKVEEFAETHGLHLLATPKKAVKKLPAVKIHIPAERLAKAEYLNEVEPQSDEVQPQNQDEEVVDEPEVVLASVSSRRSHGLRDIIKEEQENPVKIKNESKKEVAVRVKKEPVYESREDRVEELWAEKRQEAKQKRSRGNGKSNGLIKKAILGVVTLVVIGGAAFLLIPAKAKIDIQTKKEEVDFRINVVSSPNFSGVNVATSQIPGQKFVVSKEVSDKFPASGQKEVAQKAHGSIKIFNNNVGKPQRLVATTRFETPEGLVFRIPVTINVPGATKGSDGKINPGIIDSEVSADRPGPDYNIKPSSFKIPGFKGLPQYEQFSAISTTAMTGGVVGLSKVVTDEDFAKAQSQLQQKLKELIQTELKEQIAEMTLIEQGDNVKLDTPITNVKAGEAADELTMTIKGRAEIVAFRDADLEQLVASYLGKKGNFGLAHSQLKKDFDTAVYDEKTGQLTFVAHVIGQAAGAVDNEKIASDIAGMNDDEIRAYFTNVKEINSAKVALSPFWVSRVPKDQNRIRLTVE